ncbi:MAG: glycosyltransferase family 2 protein [Chthoniobacterales bacterium]
MNFRRRKISVIAGCLNEEQNLQEFVSRVHTAFRALPQYDYEIIIIDNASTDASVEVLRHLAARDHRLKVILNARNFGHVRSPYYALLQANGDAVLAMVSDLQDPPELIPQFLARWEEGFKAVVAVKNESRESSLFFLIRKAYYRLIHRLAEFDIIENFTGFGLYDRQIIEYCRKLRDPYPYFRGIIADIGLPTAKIPFVQPRRKRGLTKNNFYTLYDIAMLGITNHSKVPLRIAAMAGFAMSAFSLLIGLGYLLYKICYWDRFTVGVAPVVIGLFLFASIQLFFIGVVGEYIGSIHTQIMDRPLVVERERINFDAEDSPELPASRDLHRVGIEPTTQ